MKKLVFVFALLNSILWPLGCGKNINPSTPGGGTPVYTYPYLLTYGDTGFSGTGNGQFTYAYAVAVYGSALFVADFGGRVEKFDLNGNYLASFLGNPSKHLFGPEGIAIDKNGILYVTDNGNNQVQKLDVNGNYLATLGSGTADAALGDFSQPLAIAVDSQSNIYVTDHGNERLEKCSPTGTGCSVVGGFTYILGVAVDGSDNVWVTDQNANQIQRFNSSLGSPYILPLTVGSAAGDIDGPRGIAVDQDGNLLVCDYLNSRVEKFSTSGSYLGMIGTQGPGTHPGQFTIPNFPTVDANKNVYVSDYSNYTVTKFAPY